MVELICQSTVENALPVKDQSAITERSQPAGQAYV